MEEAPTIVRLSDMKKFLGGFIVGGVITFIILILLVMLIARCSAT
jgi:hypothetical protein